MRAQSSEERARQLLAWAQEVLGPNFGGRSPVDLLLDQDDRLTLPQAQELVHKILYPN